MPLLSHAIASAVLALVIIIVDRHKNKEVVGIATGEDITSRNSSIKDGMLLGHLAAGAMICWSVGERSNAGDPTWPGIGPGIRVGMSCIVAKNRQ